MADLGPDPSGGVYPVVIDLVDGDTLVDRLVTHLVRLPTPSAAPPLSVAWVQPLDAAPALGAGRLGRAPGRRPRPAADGGRRRLLAPTPRSTLEPTPETLDALAETDDALLAELSQQPARPPDAGASRTWTSTCRRSPGPGSTRWSPPGRTAGQDTLAARLGVTARSPDLVGRGAAGRGRSLEQLRELGVDRVVVPEDRPRPRRPPGHPHPALRPGGRRGWPPGGGGGRHLPDRPLRRP